MGLIRLLLFVLEIQVLILPTNFSNYVHLGKSISDLSGLLSYPKSEYIISSSEGKMMFQILGVFAEYEREIIVERTKAGLRRGRREGKTVGRPRINGMAGLKVKRLRDEGLSIRAIEKEIGISIGEVSSIVQKGNVI